ncbi:heavy metal translocating P-type ATPase [Undibacterium crateris]|uniref:heavy metal translocating P-type ATPase n=1 Tax=Undibacterium crateris TaxID=2528175 RepID=UPI00138A10D7|nr:cation-translocating P-type ATPase [Undibacterium crateris]NDI86624.1 heavy metal translocating P-type ATPase [Undibacterium crateris]
MSIPSGTSITKATDAAPEHYLQDKLALSGMHCAACIQLIEFRVRQIPGILAFAINPATHRADVQWDAAQTGLSQIIQAIVQLGYGALPANQSPDEFERQQNKLAIWRIFVAGFAMMQVMMYAFPAYLVPVPTADGDLTPDLDKLLKIASMVLAIPVVGFSALPFFQSAWRDIKNRHIGMDVPVSLGILLTFFASVWATYQGGAVYFDSAIMFVFLLLGARWIEQKVQKRTGAALKILTQLQTLIAQVLPGFPQQREVLEKDASQLLEGEIVLVVPGAQIPADGTVIEGCSECDESLMTGESLAIPKVVGDTVIAGAVNMSGRLVVRATQVGQQTRLASLIGMMERAAAEKPAIVLLADKHASRFLLIIMLIALVAGITWASIDPSRALWIAISVIVVTCPCALSLATPGVMAAAIGLMAQHGLLVKSGKAIQGLAEATHFVFDKTGTLTAGRMQVAECRDLTSSVLARQLAFRLASESAHPVSKAIANYLSGWQGQGADLQLQNVREVAGAGIEAELNGMIYRLGQPVYATQALPVPFVLPPELAGKSLTVLADQEQVHLILLLDDVMRDDAPQLIQSLQTSGKQVMLLSGDAEEAVQNLAALCGIKDARARMSPLDKHDVVKSLQANGARVVMIGDGMNDGPVLSIADVSIAMGQGAAISQTRSDLLLMSNRLNDLMFGLSVSEKAFRLIRENLMWAIVYNLIAIPAAVVGWLEPWHAALGMSLSSLLVVLNALRLYLLPRPAFPLTDE